MHAIVTVLTLLRSGAASARAALTTSSGAFTPACDVALREIFDRLDEDMDGALSRKELNEFLVHTEGTELDEAVSETTCTCYDTVCANVSHVTVSS